jgi:hypothetical protein
VERIIGQIDLVGIDTFNCSVDHRKLKFLCLKILAGPAIVIMHSISENFMFLPSSNVFLTLVSNTFYFFHYFQLSFYVFLLFNLLRRLQCLLLKLQEKSKIDVKVVQILLELSFEALKEIGRGFSLNILLTFGEETTYTKRKLQKFFPPKLQSMQL